MKKSRGVRRVIKVKKDEGDDQANTSSPHGSELTLKSQRGQS